MCVELPRHLRTARGLNYSRSDRFQLIRSPSVVLLEEDDELLCSFSLPRSRYL